MRLILILAIGLAARGEGLLHLGTGFLPAAEDGRYWALATGYRAGFDEEGIRLARHGRQVRVRFPGASLRWEGSGSHGARVNGAGPGYEEIRAREAFAGVDIVVRMRDGRLKTEFQLAAGVGAEVARYCVDGAAVRAEDGGRTLAVDAGEGWSWKEVGLVAWQGERDVPARFAVREGCVGFALGKVDRGLPLVIDPELAFSTYLGGGLFDAVTAVATDAQGNLYLGGWTESSDFPVLSGYQTGSGGRIDGFVAKVNAARQLVFATYLGGSGEDRVQALVVDGAGVITVAGLTASENFPVQLAARGTLAGGRDAFVTKLYPAGNQIVFSTYLGGSAHDMATGVALDGAGNVVVVGETASTNFVTQSAYQWANGGGVDGFVTRLTAAGALMTSTYFGGSGDDRIRGVAIGGDGSVQFTGATASGNFPVYGAAYPGLRGSMDGFYTKMSGTTNGILQSTYLGGSGGASLNEEGGYGIAVDGSGRTWIAGVTPSTDFPGVANGHQRTYGGGISDGFVAVFGAGGTHEWSTYVGGKGLDVATAIAAGAGMIGVAGYTTSNDLPVVAATQGTRAGEYDAFAGIFPATGTAPSYLSYLGGAGSDSGLAVAAGAGGVVVGGLTMSANLPLQGAVQAGNGGSYGGFVSQIRMGPGPLGVSPASGSGAAGTFTFSVAHAAGAANIQSAQFLFHSGLTFTNGCYFSYNRGNNTLSLYQDAGNVWLPLTPGSGTTVNNGVCSLSGTGVSVASAGATLTVQMAVTFASGFSGERRIYANATDSGGVSAGWTQVGVWQVAAGQAGPVVAGVSPASGSGTAQTFTTTITDANGHGDVSSFYFLINGTLNGANGCYLSYARAQNTIYLLRDSDGQWLPLTPGASGSVENANCRLTGAGFAVTGSGTSVSIALPLTFLGSFSGAKVVYAAAADFGGLGTGWQQVGTWSISGGTAAAPAIASVTPGSGTGTAQTFSVAMTDGNGHGDIATMQFLINGTLNGANGCYLSYVRSQNRIYLLRDSDGQWISITPGASGSIENANCRLTGAGFAVTGSGNTLTIALPLTFTSAFGGAKRVYVAAGDGGGLSTGWVQGGTWSTSGGGAAAPAIGSVTPGAGSGSAQTFSVTMTDGNGHADITSMQFLMNGTLNGANGCYLSYVRSQNTMYLLRDSDGQWITITPGASGSIENANCRLTGAGFTVTGSGNTLTVTLPLTFTSGFAGAKNVYVAAGDAGGLSTGWVQGGTWSTSGGGAAAAPTISSVTPNTGAGAAQTFSVVVSDASGHADVSTFSLLVNSVLNGANGCYLSYVRSSNTMYLLRDSDGQWITITPGASGSIENANCRLTGAGFAVTGSGNTVTFTLPLTFKTAFAGTKRLYVAAGDAGGLSTGWVNAGSWTVN
jgi:hypothetical protein